VQHLICPANKIEPKPQPTSWSAITTEELANNAIAMSFFMYVFLCFVFIENPASVETN
jgi:hypothetical protein